MIDARYLARKAFETVSTFWGPAILAIMIIAGFDSNSTVALLIVETLRAIIDSARAITASPRSRTRRKKTLN